MGYVGKVKDTAGNTHLVGSTLYGTCDTGANTAAKVVTCANFSELVEGVTIHVKFTNSNTTSSPTLNVNSTGAKNLCCYGTTRAGNTEKTSWKAGAIVSFTYDGTSWVMNDYIPDTGVTTDTKNTAGSNNDTGTLYLIGAKSQTTGSSGVQTYSHSQVYETNGALHASSYNNVGLSRGVDTSNNPWVDIADTASALHLSFTKSYTLGDACAKAVDTSISAGSTSTNLPTTKAVADFVAAQVAGLLNYAGTRSSASGAITEGDYYIASDAFTIPIPTGGTGDPITVEAGDMIIVNTSGTSMTTANVDVVQTNIETLTTTEIDNLWAAA